MTVGVCEAIGSVIMVGDGVTVCVTVAVGEKEVAEAGIPCGDDTTVGLVLSVVEGACAAGEAVNVMINRSSS